MRGAELASKSDSLQLIKKKQHAIYNKKKLYLYIYIFY